MNSIEKALDILMVFVPYNQEMGTTEISRKLGLHKATASRILLTLSKNGLLKQNPYNKKFMLGEGALKIGHAVSHSLRTNLVPLAKPFIDELREDLVETVTLEAFYRGQSMMAYVAGGPQQVRVAAEVGEVLPCHAAAGSKSILAFQPPEIRAVCLDNGYRALTSNTIVDQDDFQRHLLEVRRKGFAMDLEEIEVGICAVGVPIFDFEERAVGAVVVVGPSARIPGDEPEILVGKITETAARIAALMHYPGDFYEKRKGSGTSIN